MDGHGLVLITCGDPGEAREVGRRLVESRLAAGVQILPIESVYRWDGEVVEDQEWLLIVKTRTDRFDSIRVAVDGMHSYQVPPVLMIVIGDASRPYLDWIDENVTSAP
jgi:periplasmic divalent cation tolerance protein